MDDSIYLRMLSLCVVLLCGGRTVNGYQLKPVVLPEDVNNVRIFTEDELSQYDASNVCYSTQLATCTCSLCVIVIVYYKRMSLITIHELVIVF